MGWDGMVVEILQVRYMGQLYLLRFYFVLVLMAYVVVVGWLVVMQDEMGILVEV